MSVPRRRHRSMVARCDRSSQVVAVLFIALLAGGEGVRISDQAKDFAFAQDLLTKKSLASQDSAGNFFWWHNDVCRSRELNGGNVSAAASRYEMKYVKLQQLENTLQGDECSKGVSCPKSWIEFKSRLAHFKSCVTVLNKEHDPNNDKSPESVLVKTMKSQATSIEHLMKNSLVTVANAMQKNGMFPVGEKCGFYPARLDIKGALNATKSSAEAGNLMREQLLGKDCDSTAAQEYLNTLTKAARNTAHATMDVVNRIVLLTHHLDSAAEKGEAAVQEEVTQAVVDAEAIVKDVKTADATGDADGTNELKDKRVEELVETKQAVEDDEGSPSTALLEVDTSTMTGPDDYSFFEVFVGVVLFVLLMSLIGAYGGPLVASWQAAIAAR